MVPDIDVAVLGLLPCVHLPRLLPPADDLTVTTAAMATVSRPDHIPVKVLEPDSLRRRHRHHRRGG